MIDYKSLQVLIDICTTFLLDLILWQKKTKCNQKKKNFLQLSLIWTTFQIYRLVHLITVFVLAFNQRETTTYWHLASVTACVSGLGLYLSCCLKFFNTSSPSLPKIKLLNKIRCLKRQINCSMNRRIREYRRYPNLWCF